VSSDGPETVKPIAISTARPGRKALVLGDPRDDIQALLSVIRSLGRGGIEVHTAWHPPRIGALWSRYVVRTHQLPQYQGDDGRWKAALIGLMERERFDLVIPCTDPSLIPLQIHRSELEAHGRIYLLGDDAFRLASDKLEANRLARTLGVSLPRELVISRLDQIDEVHDELPLPLVLKPQWSYDRIAVGRRQSVRFVNSWDDLERGLREMLAAGPVAVQEFFQGRGVGVELLLCEGEPLLEFQHVRLHEPVRGGAGSYRESRALTPELRDAAVALLKAVHYTGVAMVEFKVNPQTGQWIFIEVNGRFWGSLPLAIAAGADFPLALFQLLVDGQRIFDRKYRVGLRCRSWGGDLWWLTSSRRASRSDSSLPSILFWQFGLEALASLITFRERSDTFALDDPGPAIAELCDIGRAKWRSVVRRFDRKRLNSIPVRRRLERRARAALRDACSIAFVCFGNICRSPFAEHFARRYLPKDRVIRSAGFYPEADRCCPEQAIVCAARYGIDLRGHRSQVLTDDLVRDAHVILVFDQENYRRACRDYPDARGRLHFVGALNSRGPLFVEDPYCGTLADFERSYGVIATALGTLEARSATCGIVSGGGSADLPGRELPRCTTGSSGQPLGSPV
jgi:protein-tyrosine-phosphatase/predicted ATP-grasp superfamily ATP-dependent carboligase